MSQSMSFVTCFLSLAILNLSALDDSFSRIQSRLSQVYTKSDTLRKSLGEKIFYSPSTERALQILERDGNIQLVVVEAIKGEGVSYLKLQYKNDKVALDSWLLKLKYSAKTGNWVPDAQIKLSEASDRAEQSKLVKALKKSFRDDDIKGLSICFGLFDDDSPTKKGLQVLLKRENAEELFKLMYRNNKILRKRLDMSAFPPSQTIVISGQDTRVLKNLYFRQKVNENTKCIQWCLSGKAGIPNRGVVFGNCLLAFEHSDAVVVYRSSAHYPYEDVIEKGRLVRKKVEAFQLEPMKVLDLKWKELKIPTPKRLVEVKQMRKGFYIVPVMMNKRELLFPKFRGMSIHVWAEDQLNANFSFLSKLRVTKDRSLLVKTGLSSTEIRGIHALLVEWAKGYLWEGIRLEAKDLRNILLSKKTATRAKILILREIVNDAFVNMSDADKRSLFKTAIDRPGLFVEAFKAMYGLSQKDLSKLILNYVNTKDRLLALPNAVPMALLLSEPAFIERSCDLLTVDDLNGDAIVNFTQALVQKKKGRDVIMNVVNRKDSSSIQVLEQLKSCPKAHAVPLIWSALDLFKEDPLYLGVRQSCLPYLFKIGEVRAEKMLPELIKELTKSNIKDAYKNNYLGVLNRTLEKDFQSLEECRNWIESNGIK